MYLKYKNFLFVVLVIIAVSCKQEKTEGILSKKDMVSILIRLHLAEAKTNNSYLIMDTLKIYFHLMEDSIFKAYNTDKSSFEKSYQYYMGNAHEMEKMYTQIVDSLSLREAIKSVN